MKPRMTQGFTLWELMVVVALIVFLFVAAIENLLPLRGEAERSAVLATVGTLQSALGMEAIRRTMDGGGVSVGAMVGANPMDWLAVKPANYAGVIDGGMEDLPPGHWGYDAEKKILFYRVRYPEYFRGSSMEPPGMRFRVVAKRNARGKLNGMKLEPLDAGTWITDGSEISRLLGEGQ